MFKWISTAALYLLAAVLVGWTGYRTTHLLSLTTSSQIVPLLGLAVFDGGLVVWTYYFLHGAEGKAQRAVALLAGLLDLALVALATVADVWLGGQTLVQLAPEYGEWALWLISGATAANLMLMWLAHVTDPSAIREMRLRDAKDKILEEAYRQLQAKTDDIAGQVADTVSAGMVNDAVLALTGSKKPTSAPQTPQAASSAPALPAPMPEAAPHAEPPALPASASQAGDFGPVAELAEPIRAKRNGHSKPAADPKA